MRPPAAPSCTSAHDVLETIMPGQGDPCTTRQQRGPASMRELVYNGQWFTPLREALSAPLSTDLQKTVTGDVKLKLYKGNMINAGVTSPYTLYDEEIATFGEDEVYNQADATRLHQPVRPAHCRARQAGQELARTGLISERTPNKQPPRGAETLWRFWHYCIKSLPLRGKVARRAG